MIVWLSCHEADGLNRPDALVFAGLSSRSWGERATRAVHDIPQEVDRKMMGWYGFGPAMWLVGGLVMLLVWGGLIVLIVWAVRQFTPGRRSSAEEPMDILRRRLAAGEITAEQYEEARRALQG